ncbi:hypothetical protein [Azospirillum sp.]|uniref:hypothetical protein n=1 Tax=Azospirillum sp. TaxID=34012 RepID=UPI003D7633C3
MIPHRLLLLTAAALLAASAFARPAAAQAAGCPRFDRPALQIDTQVVPLKRDFDRTLAQLQAMPGRSGGPAGARAGQVLGLAHATFGERWQVGAHFSPQPGGVVCAALARLTVTFGFQERIVYIARELPPGTCIQREVLNHEMKHVSTDEALLREFMPGFKRRLEAVAARQGTIRARSETQAMTMLRQPIDAAVRELMQDFSRERDRRQAKVDTLEEYRRVSKSCNGELAKYVKGKGRL